MKDPTLKAIRRASQEKPPPGHSEAFKWLLDRHVEFAQVLRQDRPGWETIQEKLHAAGVVGKHGQKLSVPSLIQLWGRVCLEADRRAADRPLKAKGRKANRSPKTTQPPPGVERRPDPPIPPKSHPPFASDGGTSSTPAPADADLPPEVQAKMDKLRARLRHSDRALRIGRSQ